MPDVFCQANTRSREKTSIHSLKRIESSQIKLVLKVGLWLGYLLAEKEDSRHNTCGKCNSKVMAAEVMQAEDQDQGGKNSITNKTPVGSFKWLNLKEQILHLI